MFNAQDINYGASATNNYLKNKTDTSNGFGGSTSGLGFNMDTLKLGLGGIQTIGNLWNAWQTQQLAREQFDFTKGITQTNMANQLKTYNTSLEDRIRSRGFTEGQTADETTDYLNKNRLVR